MSVFGDFMAANAAKQDTELATLREQRRELAEALRVLLYEAKEQREDFEHRRDPSAMSPILRKTIKQAEDALTKAGY